MPYSDPYCRRQEDIDYGRPSGSLSTDRRVGKPIDTRDYMIRNTLDFLRTAMYPKIDAPYRARPAPLLHPAAMSETLTVNGQFEITRAESTNLNGTAPAVLANDGGVVLWFPKDGVGTIYHMAIVPRGALVLNSPAPTWPDFRVAKDGTTVLRTSELFQFGKALTLPYIGSNNQLRVPDNLPRQFSFVRGYSGMLELTSDATPIGNTALTGSCTTGVVSNSLDIAQNTAGNACYGVIDLVESARTEMEVVKEVPIAQGVVTIQGPDVQIEYRPPNAANAGEDYGGWDDITPPSWNGTVSGQVVTGFGSGTAAADQGDALNVFSIWLSPRGVNLDSTNNTTVVMPAAGFIYNNAIPVDPIPEQSLLDVNFRMPFWFQGSATRSTDLEKQATINYDSTKLSIVTTAMHVFSYIDNEGTIQFDYLYDQRVEKTTIGELINMNGPAIANLGQFGAVGQFAIQSSVRDRWDSLGGVNGFGKYIGTRVFGTILTPGLNNQRDGPAGATDPGDTSAQVFTPVIALDHSFINVRCPNDNVEGKQGPVHVMRYERLSVGQTVQIEGLLNVEAVPKSSIANLVQEQVFYSKLSGNINVYPLLYALFMGTTDVHCSWNRKEYIHWVDNFVANFNVQTLEAMMLHDKTNRLGDATEASGLFRSLGSKLGGLVGHPKIGSAIGSIADLATGQGFTGASAQFGTRSASAPQFGTQSSSAPQFGETGAAGQFGTKSMGQFGGTIRYRE